MPISIFNSDDTPFLKWMANNPDGFVVNAGKNTRSPLCFIHRSGCSHITSYTRRQKPGAFTQRTYIKICSNNLLELFQWVYRERNHVIDYMQCKDCKPEVECSSLLFPDEVNEKLKLKEGASKFIKVNVHERNLVARAKCLEHHGFNCAVCNLNFEKKIWCKRERVHSCSSSNFLKSNTRGI